ncbi:transaldolase [Litorivicinus sp.]|jgi:transaldolase|nr:transaldolase [Litorivicinus sp.]|tara:strand:- start:13612 stop:14544 length:933 start_codon:yes stop_codon:yes gene_type:complete
MICSLKQLRRYSTVVADTADVEAIARFQPTDATTNPSLILRQAQADQKTDLIQSTRQKLAQGKFDSSADAVRELAIQFGAQITHQIPGYVSTEVNAMLSFDQQGSVNEAHKIIARYQDLGVPKERILIKLASTWEGIQAASELESEGIGCNLTLLFCESQAIAAAHAKATLISPFVGRIYDWHVANGFTPKSISTDPGVLSVQSIYRLYKAHAVKTIIMGASFRTSDQVMALAGCDKLTISPSLLNELEHRDDHVQPLEVPEPTTAELPQIERNQFLLAMASDSMAHEKLAAGITQFVEDQTALEALLRN